VRDTLRQLGYKLSNGGDDALATTDTNAATPPPTILDASQASADLAHWPPAPIKSIWKNPEPGEGEWTTPKQTWLKRLPGDAPSPFYVAFVRPDEERPYAKVLLVAMDMRQLDLDMEAGSEDPKPLTGPPGSGRVPRDPAIYTRIAAAFNGGFKTEHGAYGMTVHKRVLLPPAPGIATVIVTKDQRIGMGSWGTTKDIVGVDASDILSLRQNLDPLLDNDKVNPLGRAQWGYTLPGTGMQTERSGMCVTSAGHLVYAWGDDANAKALGSAMKMAGCVYGMHLDMNPYHTGFIFTNIADLKSKGGYQSELLTKQMEISPDRYIAYAPKDFFYMTLHDPTPQGVEGVSWTADAGAQPAPAFMPGLWRGAMGSVELFDVEPSRASFRLRAGTKEPGTSVAQQLSDDDAHRVLFALTVGTAEAKHHRGLVVDGRIALPMSGDERMGVLVAREKGELAIVATKDFKESPGVDAVELPLLLADGKVMSTHAHADAALGIAPNGRVLVARPRPGASLDDVAAALKRAGCTDAVLLERGAGDAGRMFRAGTDTPPRSRYEETTLYAMGVPLLPRGFRFEAQKPVEPAKKK
ncbi:MAG TPA: phosphodiester glycosidase family protein, partial [Labilithrix sp.]